MVLRKEKLKWNECNTIEELKLIGSFNQVKMLINRDLSGLVTIKARSWKALINKIKVLRERFVSGSTDTPELWMDGFISESHKYLFCLLELDGENRMKHLGINKLHYMDKKLAKRWRNNIFQKVHPDVCKDSRASLAVLELESLYSEMAL